MWLQLMADKDHGHKLGVSLCVIPLIMCIQTPHDKLFWPLGVGPRAPHILGKNSTIELFPSPLIFGVKKFYLYFLFRPIFSSCANIYLCGLNSTPGLQWCDFVKDHFLIFLGGFKKKKT